MLPPDNFQEEPAPVVARRTSPTNIGLYLLSVVSARDFGWIGATQAIERLEATLATMNRMSGFVVISTIGTTRGIFAFSNRSTYPPWTAATSRDT